MGVVRGLLSGEQGGLEHAYKENLQKTHRIVFNRLITITNAPIRRFKTYLEEKGEYDTYLSTLKMNFNPAVVASIMCKGFLSISYDGFLYDCDFNQALGWKLTDGKGNPLTLGSITGQRLKGMDILVGEHCLSCTAGFGSSCRGALATG